MGDRGQVKVLSAHTEPVYLYTHWGASGLAGVVARALARGRGRWSDGSYLARIVFSDMVRGDLDSLTGFGIQADPQGDVRLTIEVDPDQQVVREIEHSFTGSDDVSDPVSFEEYAEAHGFEVESAQ